VEYEGFFIGAHFDQAVDFSHTNFGTHSRFHKAVFRGPVMFVEVEFECVAEFLEVEFQQTANFSHAKFLSGTGFSGSVFHGPVDFSGVRTNQEMYFRFSEFKDQVSFQRGQFQSVLDFSNSHFEGEHDFSEAEFAVQPEFTASNISIQVPISGPRFSQQSQWLLIGLFWWVSICGYLRGVQEDVRHKPLYFDRVLQLPTKDGIPMSYSPFLVFAERFVIGFCPFPRFPRSFRS
jgi:hypothetical protein